MRKNEAMLVENTLKKAGVQNLKIIDAKNDFIFSLK
jgi:GMP synthase PP-ATPase subunit